MSSDTTLDLHVHGMDCADEAAIVRRALEGHPGVHGLEFDLVQGRVRVRFDASRTTPQAIAAALQSTGLHAHGHVHGEHAEEAHSDAHHHHDHSTTAGRYTLISGVLLLAGWIVEAAMAETWTEALFGHLEGGVVHEHDPYPIAFYAASALAGLWPLFPRAVASLRFLRLDMHVLVTVSAIGAAAVGQWGEASAVVFLFSLAHRMEAWSIERARAAVGALAAQGHAIAEGMHSPADSERWIERFAAVYTPVVAAAAVIVAIGPPLVTGEWGVWFYRALVFLVLACPCALVISTPVTVVAALTSAAHHGVVIKGGGPLERAAAGADAAARVIASGEIVMVPGSGATLPFVVAHASRALSVIRQNVTLALATKLAFLVAALMGNAPLWMAVLADTGATVLVTLNGLRLLRVPGARVPGARVPGARVPGARRL